MITKEHQVGLTKRQVEALRIIHDDLQDALFQNVPTAEQPRWLQHILTEQTSRAEVSEMLTKVVNHYEHVEAEKRREQH
jgi:hypothetical protein